MWPFIKRKSNNKSLSIPQDKLSNTQFTYKSIRRKKQKENCYKMSSTSSESNLKHNGASLATEESSHLLEQQANGEKYGSQKAVI